MKTLFTIILAFTSNISNPFLIDNLTNNYVYILTKVNQKIAQNDFTNADNLNTNNQDNPIIFIPRAKDDAPGKRKPGGSYGELNQCSSTNLLLTALVYGETITKDNGNVEDKYLLNYTAQEKPNFWFNIKDKKGSNQSPINLQFKLLNEQNTLIYQKQELIKSNDGIFAIKLDKNAPSLETNQKYYWSLTLVCDSEDNSKNAYVYGTIKKVELNQNPSQIINLNTEDKIKLYAENGLWNETISTIMEELYPQNQEKAIFLLNQLLNDAHLSKIASDNEL